MQHRARSAPAGAGATAPLVLAAGRQPREITVDPADGTVLGVEPDD